LARAARPVTSTPQPSRASQRGRQSRRGSDPARQRPGAHLRGNSAGPDCRRRRRGRRSAKNAATPINHHAKRNHSPRPPTPPGASPQVYGRQFRCSGCHRLIHLNVLALFDSLLPAEIESAEGFEPSTFRLRDGCSASIWSAPDRSGLLRLDASSIQRSRRVPSDRGNDQPDDQARRDEPACRSVLTHKEAVKRRHPRSGRPDRSTARHSGHLGAPRPGSRAGEAGAPHGRWSAPAVRCSTGQRAGRGAGRPPTRPPGRAGPGCCRGYGPRRGRTPNGCGHPG
jgi:hypothetical protein